MIRIPAPGSAAREAMDIGTIVEIFRPENRKHLRTFPEVRVAARDFLNACSAARSVNYVCIRANGDFELVNFGRRGGHKTIWNFSR